MGADALAATAAADGALVVFRATDVPGAAEISLLETMRQAQVKVVGVVLNDARAGAIEPIRLPLAGEAEPEVERAPRAFATARSEPH